MRRLSSIFLTTAALVAGVLATSGAASAANSGVATKKTSATVAPAAVPNAKLLATARLTKTSSFLVAGVDTVTAGAHVHLWKMKDDLTIDSTFTAVDLGNEFALPTASNSTCVASQNMNIGATCYYTSSLSVNETTGTYALAISRSLNGAGNSSGTTADVTTFIVGKISNGAVTAKMTSVTPNGSQSPISDWSAYGTNIFSDNCTSIFGATTQSVPLSSARSNIWVVTIRPDGSLLYDLQCVYTNSANISAGSPGTVKQFQFAATVAVKPSGGALVADTSWGTNGVLKTFDDPTKCGFVYPVVTSDSSISSNSSTKIFTILQKNVTTRSTTIPSWMNNQQGVTGYDGCEISGPSSSGTNSMIILQADGSVKASPVVTSISSGSFGRWIIDPTGRWNSIINTGTVQVPKISLFRVNTKGEFDTTLGANGLKEIPNMPATVTVNGSTINMRYSLTGIASTANGIYFTGMSTAGANSFMCNNSTTDTTYYPYYVSPDTGLLTTYGTNGLGEGVKITDLSSDFCRGSSARLRFINGKGQHAYLQQTIASGSQTAGIMSVTWDAADGIVSGGDGIGVVGTGGRTDTKVYSKSLPTKVEDDTALTVLTAKQAKDLDLRSITPKVCVALTTSVLMLNPGKCTVQVIDEDTKKVLRTMRTTVATAEQEEGSTLTTDEPIMFKQAATTLSKKALEQVAAIAAAAGSAKKVVVIGHSAALGEVSAFSYAISRDRANAVKAALVKAGVKASIIETVALSYSQPLTTKKSESAQAKNRRAEVFILE